MSAPVTFGLLQMTAGLHPAANARTVEAAVGEAAGRGAKLLFTPEMTNLVDRDRRRAAGSITSFKADPVLAATRAAARRHGVAVALGSLAVRRADGMLANRSVFVDGSGEVLATYDKMHLFDVALGGADDWRESAAYGPGERAAVVDWRELRLGLSICYDLRFPALYQALSGAGATILTVPAAFTVPTGRAHWRTLLTARAIENAAFVVAAAQTGRHADGRQTWGHSTVVDPWGEVLLEMGEGPGVGVVTVDLARVDEVRARIDVLGHRRAVPPVDCRAQPGSTKAEARARSSAG